MYEDLKMFGGTLANSRNCLQSLCYLYRGDQKGSRNKLSILGFTTNMYLFTYWFGIY